MPRARYDKVEPERRARLLEAASREFAAHGYELASINRILEDAGFSKGSFYYYFDDKADLATMIFVEAIEADAVAAKAIFSGHPPRTADEFWTELTRTGVERVKLMQANRVQYECVFRLSNALMKDAQLAARLMPSLDLARQTMAGFLERGVSLGALRNDLPMGTLIGLLEAVKTAAYKTTFPGDRIPSNAELDSFGELMLDLMKRIAAPPRP